MRTKQPWRILFNIYINIEDYQAFFCISTHCENWKRKKRENMLSFMWKLISTEEHMAICVHVHLVILISKYFFLLYFRSYISRAHIKSSQLHWLGNCYKWFAFFFRSIQCWNWLDYSQISHWCQSNVSAFKATLD